MCMIDLEPCVVWRETKRRARKRHKCGGCGGLITAGEQYLVHFSVFEGNTSTSKLCLPCDQSRREFADHHDAGLCQPDYFYELLQGCIAEGDDESDVVWAPMLAAMDARRAAAKASA
jgi:hypothetical protein